MNERTASDSLPQSSQSQPTIRHEPLVTRTREKENSERYVVRIRSYRCGRLCDPDNLVGKYFVDALRYAGIIPDDTPEKIIYQIAQEKVKTRKEERTEVEVDRAAILFIDLEKP